MNTTKEIKLFKANERGFANHGWLQATHSFSFANYYDPEKIQYGALRVLNDDLIAPSMGFGMHPHQNMEIITIPLSGLLKHRDSMHNQWQEVKPGEVQVMSAGTGVTHSEINGSPDKHLSLFQIWIMPDTHNVAPRYGQKSFSPEERNNAMQWLVTSMDSDHEGSLKIHQNARIGRINLSEGKEYSYNPLSDDHGTYVMNITGEFEVDDNVLEHRDAVGISGGSFNLKAKEDSDILVIEIPM